uniref:Putative serine/threonine protein kinase n=2 Tax=Nyssomyia neivai TaxID=330878 RepID=A0A1L8DKT0_9DIPT
MIHVDESDPIGEIEPNFATRDVTIRRGVDAKEHYEMIKEIGRGKFGTVYKCREKSTRLELAAKFVPIPKRDDRRNVEREVEIMNSLHHPLIIQLYDAFEFGKMMCVVLDLIEGGELFERVIDDDFILTEKACIVFVRQLCEAMEFVHRKNILHLDLKPENIMCLTREGNRIKIIDFGLARKFDPNKKLQVLFGTPEFVAPEVVNFDSISFGTDMWSVGVICYVLLSGLSPFMGETDIETMANVTISKYDFDDDAFRDVSSEAIDFISSLLVKDAASRMTATECLEHVWLKKRPPRPSLAPKPIAVPPPKYIKEPSPVPNNKILNGNLDTTKDNLKTFVERWGEHPNSPYIFDTDAQFISPLSEDSGSMSTQPINDGNLSSRGCSPSPCGSVSSSQDVADMEAELKELDNNSPDMVNGEEWTESPKPSNKMFREYLQCFERRNSDSNFVLKHSNSMEKINLADEIKKLSDRLLMLSAINIDKDQEKSDADKPSEIKDKIGVKKKPETKAKLDNKSSEDKKTEVKSEVKEKMKVKSDVKTNNKETIKAEVSPVGGRSPKSNSSGSKHEIPNTKSNLVESFNKSINQVNNERTEIISKTSQFTRSRSVIGNSLISSITESLARHTKTSVSITKEPKINGFTERLTKTIEETPAVSAADKITLKTAPITVPWANRRTKFRMTEFSRDVPVGSPHQHPPIYIEEAANTTKDCLLHLLEKYNGVSETRTPSISTLGRHQSFSCAWGAEEDLEKRSMNSINAFFQRHASHMGKSSVKQMQATIEGKGKI